MSHLAIPDLRSRWEEWKKRARKIVPEHFQDRGFSLQRLASFIPSDPNEDFPADIKQGLTGEGIRKWIEKGRIPNEGKRPEHWEKLTGLSLAAWQVEASDEFMLELKRVAGEVNRWDDLVKASGLGVIKIMPYDRTITPAQPLAPMYRFKRPNHPLEKKEVIALPRGLAAQLQVELPLRPDERDDVRLWALSFYKSESVFVLDPEFCNLDEGTTSRLRRNHWRGRGNHALVSLPRNKDPYVLIEEDCIPGTEFTTVVSMFDLSQHGENVVAAFSQLERRLTSADKAADFKFIRHVLDDTAALVSAHRIVSVFWGVNCKVT